MEMKDINIYDYELNDEEEETIEKIKTTFKIANLEGCNWVFRKLAKLKKEATEVNSLAAKEIERIQEWQASELKKQEDSKNFFEGLLSSYFIDKKMKDPKFKISTPYGKVSSKKQQPSYQYDADKFIKWADENEIESFIRIKKEINKVAVKELSKINGNQLVDINTGQILEGVTVFPREDSIIIKIMED